MNILNVLRKLTVTIVVLTIVSASILTLYKDREKIAAKVSSFLPRFLVAEISYDDAPLLSEADIVWANKILEGGYILHFRHAERAKWIDVQMYDSLESDVHGNGVNNSRLAETDYFAQAVCLNDRGTIQARAMGEHLRHINLPIGYVISSPICRARQTAELAFGGYDRLDRDLVHRGPYNQSVSDHVASLVRLYSDLPMIENSNTVVSAHNSVVHADMFPNVNGSDGSLDLEEGGFYVISKTENGLRLEHEFHSFRDFTRVFYIR